MNRQKKLMRNIVLLLILGVILFSGGPLYLDPMAAHRASERSIHYGPSEVVHVENFPGGKYYLGKYDQWISCNTVNRTLGIFWRFGSQVTGIEVNEEKPVSYTWSYSEDRRKAYGVLNDKRTKRLEVHLTDGTVLTQRVFYQEMFLLTWTGEAEFSKIVAYDSTDAVIFEEEGLGYKQ